MGMVTHEDILKIAKKITTDVDWERIDVKENLSEQGIDSLDMMNIIFAFQEKYGVAISDESISRGEWHSVDSMVESLNKARIKNDG